MSGNTKKLILEQGDQANYKRVTLEQGTSVNANTPQWNILTSTIKEKTAVGLTTFGASFVSNLVPACIVGVVVVTVILWLICNQGD